MELANIRKHWRGWGLWRRIGARLSPFDRRLSPFLEDAGEEGAYGEAVALAHLRRLGFKFLVANYRSRWGEIDLVCRHHQTLVFVEVKTRGPNPWASPAAAVNPSKQRRLIRTAQAYLQELSVRDVVARFDVVEVFLLPGQLPECRLIEAAFSLPD